MLRVNSLIQVVRNQLWRGFIVPLGQRNDYFQAMHAVRSRLSFVVQLRLEEFLGFCFAIPALLAPFILAIRATSSDIEAVSAWNFFLEGARSLVFLLLIIYLIWKDTPRTRFLRDYVPFLFVIFIYLRIHDLIFVINPSDFHPLLIHLENTLFGGQPTLWLQQFYHPWLTEWFALAYLHYYLVTFILVTLIYRAGDMVSFREIMLTMMITYYLGFLGYLLFPTASPYIVLEGSFTTDLWAGTGPFSWIVQQVVDLSPNRARDAFPSLHNAVTILTLIMAWKVRRRFFWIHLPFALSLVVATVYLQYHFVLDVIAGLIVMVLALRIVPVLRQMWRSLGEKLEEIEPMGAYK